VIATKSTKRERPSGAEAWEYDLAPTHDKPRATRTAGSSRAEMVGLDRPVFPSSPIIPMALVFLASAGLFAYSAHCGYLIGEIAVVVMFPCALHGVWRGGFRKTMMLGAITGLFYLFSVKPDFAAPVLSSLGAPTSGISNFAAGAVTALLAILTAYFGSRGLQRRLIAPSRISTAIDRFAGTLIGVAEGALVALCLCWMASSLRPYATNLVHGNQVIAGSPQDRIGKYMLQIAEEADEGLLGRVTKATNPIDQVPALREAITQLNTTGRLDIESLSPATISQIQSILQQCGVSNSDLDSLLKKSTAGHAIQEESSSPSDQ
jgi:uncharacterized membrane protein required for colicin V production